MFLESFVGRGALRDWEMLWSKKKLKQTSTEDDLPTEFFFCQFIYNLTVLIQTKLNDFHAGNSEAVDNLNNLLQLPFGWCILFSVIGHSALSVFFQLCKSKVNTPQWRIIKGLHLRVNVCGNDGLNDHCLRSCIFKSLMLKYSNAFSVRTGCLIG